MRPANWSPPACTRNLYMSSARFFSSSTKTVTKFLSASVWSSSSSPRRQLLPRLLRRLEHLQEAARRFFRAAETPERPRALEERDVVELAVLVLEHLLVLREGEGVVGVVLRELVLGAHHVRVRHEAALGEPLEDLVEARLRLVELALLAREEAVHVEREVVILEGLVLAEHREEARARFP